MKQAAPIREKHDGALGNRSSVRVWLRLLSCTMAIEKEVQRRFAGRLDAGDDALGVERARDRGEDVGVSIGEGERYRH